ncbi:MAG TPA: DUF4956 domain-containing protein [Gemmatimonadales bacterium]|nr:DUF4956 domain-containing protein [Gemmatimonadales bacterium]
MSEKAESTAARRDNGLPKPRFVWLGLFQVVIIALVVVMARETRGLTEPPMLEDQLGALTEGGGGAAAGPWGGRGWVSAVVAMVGALLLMLPVAWAYAATRVRKEMDSSVVSTIVVLPIAVAAILVIVQDSLAVAFSLAGIAGLVRFRNALDDTRDAMYVVIAIAVGLGAGVGTLEAAAALTGLYVLAVVALWKWNTSQPVIADVALGEREMPKGGTMLEALTADNNGRHPNPVAEWFESEQSVALDPAAEKPVHNQGKRDGMLRVHAATDVETRREIEDVLESRTKRWTFESDDRGADGLPMLTYCVRLKKRTPSESLLEALQERLGRALAEYTPNNSGGHGGQESAA